MADTNKRITQGGPNEMGPGSRMHPSINGLGRTYAFDNTIDWNKANQLGSEGEGDEYVAKHIIGVETSPENARRSAKLTAEDRANGFEGPYGDRLLEQDYAKAPNIISTYNPTPGKIYAPTVSDCKDWAKKILTSDGYRDVDATNIEWLRNQLKRDGKLNQTMDYALTELRREAYNDPVRYPSQKKQEMWKPSQALIDGIRNRF